MRACGCIHTPCNRAVAAMVTRQVASQMRASHLMHPKPIYLLLHLRQRDRQRTLERLFSDYSLPLVVVISAIFIRTVRYQMALTCRCVRLSAPCVSGPCVYTAEGFFLPRHLRQIRLVHFASPPASAVVSLPRADKDTARHTGSVLKPPWPVQGVVRH